MRTKTLYPLFSAIVTLTLVSLACTATASAPTPTPTATSAPATATSTSVPTNTPKPSLTPKPTKTPNLAATQVVEENRARIQEYVSKGYISSTEGELFELDDVIMELAQAGYLSDPYLTGFNGVAKDFVFRADFKWENAVQRPETSGCGFYFRVMDNGDFYSAYLDTERVVVGGVDVSAGNYLKRFGVSAGNGRVDFGNPAEANFTFIMNENIGTTLINDQYLATYTLYQGKMLDAGSLYYFIKSGTNKDYGTRCEITNASLWIVK